MVNLRCIFGVGECVRERPDAVGVGRSCRVVSCFISGLGCTSVRLRAAADRSIQTPASWSAPSATQFPAQPEEYRQMWVVVQYPVDQLASGADDLARNLNEGVQEGLELHPQHSMFLFLMLFPPTAILRQPQRPPRLEVPSQTGHHHVSPIAVK